MMGAEELEIAMTNLGEHTFRNGLVVARIGGFSSDGNKFTIDSVFATYDNIIVELDCPIHWVGVEFDSEPVLIAHQLVSDLVRSMV
jgi:hypothetical protein